MSTNFHSLIATSLHSENGPVNTVKIKFNFHMLMTLGQGQIFVNSISFTSQTAIVFETIHCFHFFPIEKPKLQNLTLP